MLKDSFYRSALLLCLLLLLSFFVLYAQQSTPSPTPSTDNQNYLIDENVLIKTKDGATLSAVVVRKKDVSAPQPTALMFFIYSNLERSLSEAKQAADRGYVGMVADVRGKRLSPDEVEPYEHEATDVYEVVDWISKQSWSNRKVGMYGGSYSGFAQWAGLKKPHPALKTIVPYVAGIPGMGLPMENNIFINANYEWAFYVTNNKYLDNDANNDRQRWRTMRNNWFTSGRAYREIDRIDGTPNKFLQRWLQHPAYDEYWQKMVPYKQDFAKINIPVLAIDGYYNDGQVSGLHYLREHAKYNTKADDYLIIGPYDHFGAQRGGSPTLRGYKVDPVALINTRDITFQWFDYIMKEGAKPATLKDRINYQVMGANTWQSAPSLKKMSNDTLTFYLSNTKSDDILYQLSAKKLNKTGFLEQEINFTDREAYDNFNFPDPILQTKNDVNFSHVYAFVSQPLSEPITINGAFSGALKTIINKKDMDFSVVLYEITPTGEYLYLSYILARASYAKDASVRKLLRPGKIETIPFDKTKLISRRLEKGSRLLVFINGNKNPFAQINYGTGKDVSDETIADGKEPLKIKWLNDSYIKIPILK